MSNTIKKIVDVNGVEHDVQGIGYTYNENLNSTAIGTKVQLSETGQNQLVFGQYNEPNPDKIEIVGNGNESENRNIRVLDAEGNEELAGDLTVNDAVTFGETKLDEAAVKELLTPKPSFSVPTFTVTADTSGETPIYTVTSDDVELDNPTESSAGPALVSMSMKGMTVLIPAMYAVTVMNYSGNQVILEAIWILTPEASQAGLPIGFISRSKYPQEEFSSWKDATFIIPPKSSSSGN